MRNSLTLVLLLGLFSCLSAQTPDDVSMQDSSMQKKSFKKTYWELGLFLGGSALGGDVIESDRFFLKNPDFSYGLDVKRYLTRNFALKLHAYQGFADGDDRDNKPELQNRGLSFKTTLTDFGLTLEYDLLGHRRIRADGFHRVLSPYFFGGIGLVISDPQPELRNPSFQDRFQQDLNADYSKVHRTNPVGVGLKYDLSSNWSLGLEVMFRNTGTDYLDGISIVANPNKDDWFASAGFKLFYRADRDACPDDPNKTEAGECGCGVPDVDSDGDGVLDCNDNCPNDAYKTEPGACGCGQADTDSDGDGTLDCNDGCPQDPNKTEAGACGCGQPDTDSDGDGTPDCNDDCPNDPNKTGPGECGCGNPDTDTDGDGVADCKDDCPTVAGDPARGGCPDTPPCPDRDGDGVCDEDDDCPDVAGLKSRRGCPDEELAELARNINFETGSAQLQQRSYAILDSVYSFMQRYPDFQLQIEGHTDSQGREDYNQTLSENRALSVYNYLLSKGIPASRMTHQGFGESRPIATNDTAEGRARNRRTEMKAVD